MLTTDSSCSYQFTAHAEPSLLPPTDALEPNGLITHHCVSTLHKVQLPALSTAAQQQGVGLSVANGSESLITNIQLTLQAMGDVDLSDIGHQELLFKLLLHTTSNLYPSHSPTHSPDNLLHSLTLLGQAHVHGQLEQRAGGQGLKHCGTGQQHVTLSSTAGSGSTA